MDSWLAQYCINVTDLDRTVAFYEALGLTCTSRTDIEVAKEAILEEANSKGGKVQLAEQLKNAAPLDMGNAFWKLYVNTNDIDRLYKSALDFGAESVTQPSRSDRWPVTVGFVKDPDGYLVEFVQRHPWLDGDDSTYTWLGQYCINVTDIDASIKFWETLGLECTSQTDIQVAKEAILENRNLGGKVQLAQQLEQGGPIDMGTSMWKLYVYTDDCAGLYEQAVGVGYRSVTEPIRLERWPTSIAFVADPDGYQVEIVQRHADPRVAVSEPARRSGRLVGMPIGTVLVAANFTPAAITVLVVSGVFALLFAIYFVVRWAASFPDLPNPGPETSELGTEPPAIANLLVNRCQVTSAAAAATLIDLAARRHLELQELAADKFVMRIRDNAGDVLNDYEDQVMSLVREKATGGSAPLEVIELDESQAGAWRGRFAKQVVSDARSRGLLRGRWTRVDWVVFGVLIAAVLFALAGGLYLANVHQKGDKKNEGFDRETWFLVVLVAWPLVMAVLRRLRSIRYSATGDATAARWLGVKRFLQHDESFGDTPPAGVAIWDRLLAYGAALGVARGAVAAIPLEEEDPEVAWSRVGGNWHQVHVEYPKHFGYGERPSSVLLNGALRTLMWGAIVFVLLPTFADVVWNVGSDAVETVNDAATFGFVVGFGLIFGGIAAVVLVRLGDGLIRTYRGARDLRARTTVDGQVVKHHTTEGARWFAVDPGDVDELKACHPGDDGVIPPRGATVRMVLTPHLRHVVSVEVLKSQ